MIKRLIISHIADIDGMGSVVLAKLFFKDIDYILIEPKDLDNTIEKLINNNIYDEIFITDLALLYDTGVKIMNSKLNVKHFDHHETNKFDFPFSIVEEKRGNFLPSGTSLFYEYLNKKYNFKNSTCDIFVESTRACDTYTFEQTNDKYSKALSHIFIEYGPDLYIDTFSKRLNSDCFFLTEDEIKINDKYIKDQEEYIKKCDEKLIIGKIGQLNVGLSISKKYRSQVGNRLAKKHVNLDFILIANFERKSFSLRSSNSFNVGKFAFEYGGGGHYNSAGIPFNDKSVKLLTYFIKNDDINKYAVD